MLAFVNIANIAIFNSSQCYIHSSPLFYSSHCHILVTEIHTVFWDTCVQPPHGVSWKHLSRWLIAHLQVLAKKLEYFEKLL